MLDALSWLLAVQVIGLAAFPLAHFLFPRLADRGYSLSKPLGIVLVAYLSWALSQTRILPSTGATIAVLVLALVCLSGWCAWKQRRELLDFASRERVSIIAAEALFLGVFAAWAIFRSFDPSIDHTEQPMDLMFLNASMRTETGTPEDLWLSGQPVSYYYFGYWTMGALAQLAGVTSAVAYNLAMALVPALAALSVAGVAYNLVRAESGRLPAALAGGGVAALLVVFAGNLAGVFEFMHANAVGSERFWDWLAIDGLGWPIEGTTQSWRPEENWWWFRATRVINTFTETGSGIDYTIQEFPFFSFMLGDLHPHVMSLPLVALFLGAALNFWLTPYPGLFWHHWRSALEILVVGFLLGALAFTNTWDLPVFWALIACAALLRAYAFGLGLSWPAVLTAGATALAVLALALLLFLPYYLTFRAGVGGIGAVSWASSRPVHLLAIWAPLLVGVAPMVAVLFWRTTLTTDWVRMTVAALVAGLAPFVVWAALYLAGDGGLGGVVGRFFHVLPFAALVGMAVYSALWLARENNGGGAAFSMLAAAFGMLLIMGPELLYVDDSFGPPSERMNTVFKLYYQAWIILATISGFAIYFWASLRAAQRPGRRALTTLWACVFAALLLGALYYAPAAAASKAGPPGGQRTLDGLAYLRIGSPAEFEAIEYLREHAGDSVMLEAVGEWHDAGLISRGAGVPTPLNWPGHQAQWRGASPLISERDVDVELAYRTLDASVARGILDKYGADLVYVGQRERNKYGEGGFAKFAEFMDVAFSQGGVSIYRLPQEER